MEEGVCDKALRFFVFFGGLPPALSKEGDREDLEKGESRCITNVYLPTRECL